MAETTMPATEAAPVALEEKQSYELAFHVLPTVAEGEVPSVFEGIKAYITKNKGEITIEEAPELIDLAYNIVQHVEGKNKKFRNAYFGWVRFVAEPETMAALEEQLRAEKAVLRHLIIKLTREEEAHPFMYHERRKKDTMVREVSDEDILSDPLSPDSLDEASAATKKNTETHDDTNVEETEDK